MTTPDQAPNRVWIRMGQEHPRTLWWDSPPPGSEPSVEYVRVGREVGEAITSDSSVYMGEFYGILNAQGQFWTPLAFDSPQAAQRHIRDFWPSPQRAASFLRGSKIVPVRVQLTAIQAPEKQP